MAGEDACRAALLWLPLQRKGGNLGKLHTRGCLHYALLCLTHKGLQVATAQIQRLPVPCSGNPAKARLPEHCKKSCAWLRRKFNTRAQAVPDKLASREACVFPQCCCWKVCCVKRSAGSGFPDQHAHLAADEHVHQVLALVRDLVRVVLPRDDVPGAPSRLSSCSLITCVAWAPPQFVHATPDTSERRVQHLRALVAQPQLGISTYRLCK